MEVFRYIIRVKNANHFFVIYCLFSDYLRYALESLFGSLSDFKRSLVADDVKNFTFENAANVNKWIGQVHARTVAV